MQRMRALQQVTGDYGRQNPGDTFWCPDSVAASLSERGIAVYVQRPEVMAAPAVERIVPTSPKAEKALKWTLKVTPKEYLERHPNGPNAALARELLA